MTKRCPSRFLQGLTICAVAALFADAGAQEQPLYLTVETPPAPELTPAEALQSFTLAPGFTIELVAAEPLVEDPVSIKWDEDGRLYVVEMRGFMPDAYGNGEKDPVGVVARLADTSGDGIFDSREVLLDKLVLPRAIALVNEGLLVGEPPNLWLCPSASGRSADIDCSKKANLGSYGDQPGSVEHAENGLLTGIDNWLYSAKSNRRMRLRNGELVVEPTLFRGQWGIAQDNDGRLFYNTNSNLLLGDFYDAQQVINAGNATAPGLGARISTNDQLFASRVNTGVNRAYVAGVLREDGRLNRPTSAAGMVAYRGDQFPTHYANDVFVAEPAANAIVQLRLNREGLEIGSEHILYPDEKWGQVEYLTSTDERFRPISVEVGPDGALYVIDMYRGIIQDHVFLSDELRAQALERQLEKPVGMGRIWRITATDGPGLRDATELSAASVEQLVGLLGANNAWQRETAQRLLVGRGMGGRESGDLNRHLRDAVKTGNALQAVHALWALAGRGALNRKTLLAALARPESSVDLSAVRAAPAELKRTDLLKLAKETSDPALQQQLTFALADHNAHPDVVAHMTNTLVAQAHDSYLVAAIKAASLNKEVTLLARMEEKSLWNPKLEAETKFVQQLVKQGFSADPTTADSFLDFVAARSAGQQWLQSAVLAGLYDVSREDGFERVTLGKAHPLFSSEDETLWPAIAGARRAFTWPGDDLAAAAKPLSPAQKSRRAKGAAFYASRCASCHGRDGQGIASLAPPLADSIWVTGPSEYLARIMLHGLSGSIEVAGKTWNGVMPGHAAQPEFDDEVASGLMTHLNRSWGHAGRAIDPEFVANIRKETADRNSMWTVPELKVLDTNTHYTRYTGRYGGPEFVLQFVYNGSNLEVKSGIFNGPMTALKEDQFVFEPRQLKVEFVFDNAGKVVGIRMPRGDGYVLLPRLGS